MKEYRKEFILCIIALMAAGGAFWIFSRSIRQEKEVSKIDLYNIVASEPTVLLHINRLPLLNRTLTENKELQNAFDRVLPTVYRYLLQEQDLPSALFSFHPSGILFYTSITDKQADRLEKKILPEFFSGYSSQSYKKYGIEFVYYPDTENRFFGYFHSGGLWVAGYSRKLLEEVARCYIMGNGGFPVQTDSIRHTIDMHSPANLWIKSELLNLSYPTEEEEENNWELKNHWLGCDLFISEGNICLFTTFPNSVIPEHFVDTLSIDFTKQIKLFSPELQVDYHLQQEETSFYYTACTPLLRTE